MTTDPVIIALDFDSAPQTEPLVKALGDSAGFYKVGMELFAAAGMDYVRCLVDRGKRVFLDMKYYDIGETVRRAVAVVARSGALRWRPASPVPPRAPSGTWTKRVRQAMALGIEGIVGSPVEARAIRQVAGPDAILVTPAEAVRDGADYIVIGRQVTRAADPAAALARIHDELRQACRT